jgi:hypothetical protein
MRNIVSSTKEHKSHFDEKVILRGCEGMTFAAARMEGARISESTAPKPIRLVPYYLAIQATNGIYNCFITLYFNHAAKTTHRSAC